MHYYSFNIGDYISHTRHLLAIEDLAYRRLLDLYYLHEQPLNECSTAVARSINMREHEVEVVSVLEEFFKLIEGTGWVNPRADEEIAKYHSKLESASRAGVASAAKRVNARATTVQPNKKQEPITKETIKKETRKKETLSKPDEVSASVWDDFLKCRKAKKAPLTATALKGIAAEALRANYTLERALQTCCQRGWVGFNADWVQLKPGLQPLAEKNYGSGGEL